MRPLLSARSGAQRDATALAHAARRAEADPKRSEEAKASLVKSLAKAYEILCRAYRVQREEPAHTKPMAQGANAIRKDVQHLTRCMHRVQADPSLPTRTKTSIVSYIREAIVILVSDDRKDKPVKKIA